MRRFVVVICSFGLYVISKSILLHDLLKMILLLLLLHLLLLYSVPTLTV